MRAALIAVLLAVAACAPVTDTAHYVVDGVRMEVTRDRTVVDTSRMQAPPATEVPGAVVLGPGAVSRGLLIRRADGAPVTEADRPRAEAAFALYCAARGQRAPARRLLFDRADAPTAFFGLCTTG